MAGLFDTCFSHFWAVADPLRNFDDTKKEEMQSKRGHKTRATRRQRHGRPSIVILFDSLRTARHEREQAAADIN